MHSGDTLKITLARHGISGDKLAALYKQKYGKGSPRTVYDWFSKEKIKPAIIARISAVTGIDADELSGKDLPVANEHDPGYGNKPVHHGNIVRKVLEDKGMKIENFARKMGMTRGTMYSRFDESIWNDGELLQAADILSVPVAQLKGKGDGFQAFQKDIYDELHSVKLLLQKIYEQLLLTSVS